MLATDLGVSPTNFQPGYPKPQHPLSSGNAVFNHISPRTRAQHHLESPGAKSRGGIPDSASGIATGSATHPEITRRPRPFFEATCAPMVYKCQIISGKRQFPACCETPACSHAKSGFLGENKEMLRAAKLMEGNWDSHRHHCGVLRGAGGSALGRMASERGSGGCRGCCGFGDDAAPPPGDPQPCQPRGAETHMYQLCTHVCAHARTHTRMHRSRMGREPAAPLGQG